MKIVCVRVVYKIPYRRARLASTFRPSARASKVILHTSIRDVNQHIIIKLNLCLYVHQ